MEYRKLAGENVSTLGFGGMRFPIVDGNPEKIHVEKATKMVKDAIENGINYFDTAWPYHTKDFSKPGYSEPFLGEVLKNIGRDKVKIATKLPVWLVENREDMDVYLEKQLERLQTDYIDYYLLHALNETRWRGLLENGVIDFMKKIKASGKVKHIGFSFHDELPAFKEIVDGYDEWEFCQIQYNYFDTDYQAGAEGLKYAKDRDIDVIIMEPLRGGGLSKLGDTEMGMFKEAGLEGTPTKLALEWLYNDERISLVLSGMSEDQHIEENIETTKSSVIGGLSKDQIEVYSKVRKSIKSKIKVSCTQCGYCTPCPVGVNIPENFRLLNTDAMFEGDYSSKHSYNNRLTEKTRASNCVECRKCEKLCPQKIEISQDLKKVVTRFEG